MARPPLLPDQWKVETSPESIRDDWRALEAEAVGTPFQAYNWVRLFLDVQGEDAVIVTGRSGGKLQIVFPLTVRNGVVEWLGEALTNYNMPMIARDLYESIGVEDVEKMWASVRSVLGNPTTSVLRRQPMIMAGRPNPFAQWSSVVEPIFAYATTLDLDLPQFQDTMSSETQKTLRKKTRYLERNGPVSISRVAGSEAIRNAAEHILQWKSDQVDAGGGKNNFASKLNREVLVRYAVENADTVRLYGLTVADELVALLYWIDNGVEPISYQMAYASGASAKYSPGYVLMYYVIDQAMKEGARVLDFAVGDEAFKQKICDRLTNVSTSLKAHAPAGYPKVVAERAKLAAKAALKSNAVAFGAVRKANSLIKSLGRRSSEPAAS
jgi:CelD/BcsL family acetyltransferase involved in cellulose biosynthesis